MKLKCYTHTNWLTVIMEETAENETDSRNCPLLTVRWVVKLETQRVAGIDAPSLHHTLGCVHETLALECPTTVSVIYVGLRLNKIACYIKIFAFWGSLTDRNV